MPAQNQPPPLPNGTKLNKGRYTIESHLGGGGFGHVYLARDAKQQPFAVKQCTDFSKEAVALFGHEIAVLKMLASQSSMYPQVYEDFEEDFPGGLSYAFAVMEFVPGRTLESLIDERSARRQGSFGEPNVLAWTTQLLGALEYTHSRGIIHRDVKPANIMLSPDGKQIKIIDVGIAKIGDVGDKTQAGASAVSSGFSPPEQYAARAGQTGRFSDIYSVGATMYNLLTLVIPPEAMGRVSGGQALIPPRQLNPQITPQTESVILQAMELHVGNRYQSAAEMLAALQGRPQPVRPVGPTQTCPNCGGANQMSARFCSQCGFSMQGLIFQQSGIRVQNVADLPGACDRAWAEAIGYMATGKLDQWLRSAGTTGQAWAGALQSVRAQYPTNPNLQLDSFLRMIDPQRPLPVLQVQATPTASTTVEQGVSHNVAITISNGGGGILLAALSAAETWVSLQPNNVQLLAGKSQVVAARFDTTSLSGSRGGSLHTAQVNVQSNGGSHSVTLQVQVTAAPRLNVQPRQIDFGEARHGQSLVRTLQIANDGAGSLQARIQSNESWLTATSTQALVPMRSNQSIAVQAETRKISQRGVHSGELYIDAGQDGNAVVQATIKLAGPVSLSSDATAAINSIEELAAWCDAHWNAALQLLRNGELYDAVSYLGEPNKGIFRRRDEPWSATLAKVKQAALQRDGNLGLELALRALGAPRPTYTHNWRDLKRQLGLGLIPDLRWMMPWWQGPGTVEFRIKNQGRGYLRGRLLPEAPWLVIDPASREFGCLPGQEARLQIRVLKQRRQLKGWKPVLFKLQVE